ncbi:hypothetical protein D9756_010301 [Leucocoprinus leucothites]|uniref:Uncharacterized protein n=1 Tax=Leucocoprinus leucothites TaxID=201217 RepID=A0A8H5CW30_9AGAR|nr:hypothetical protein D9756_010301 [Leucoagaricus leucothites]
MAIHSSTSSCKNNDTGADSDSYGPFFPEDEEASSLYPSDCETGPEDATPYTSKREKRFQQFIRFNEVRRQETEDSLPSIAETTLTGILVSRTVIKSAQTNEEYQQHKRQEDQKAKHDRLEALLRTLQEYIQEEDNDYFTYGASVDSFWDECRAYYWGSRLAPW